MSVLALDIRPSGSALGARVEGIDLSRPVPKAVFDEIYQAWLKHLVLSFPNQKGMSIENQIAFSRMFGDLDTSSLAKKTLPGHPEIFVIGTAKKLGEGVGGKVSPSWHSDGQFLEKPTKAAFLHSQIIPDEGGDTRFANMYAAYDALPPDMKKRIEGLRVVHSRTKTWPILFPSWPPQTEEEKASMPDVTHPLVRTHPESKRKCLYVGGNSGWCIEGMDVDEGRALMKEIRDFATQDRFVYTHKWTLGEALLWDNRCTMHLPPDYDPTKVERLMYRTTIRGDRPY